MAKPFIDFTAVKAAVSFGQVLERYGLAAKMHSTRNGDGLDGPCPIHPDTTSKDIFKVTLSKNCWYCHNSACKCGGNHLDFVAKMENCTAQEAALKLDNWFNLGLAGKPDSPPPAREHREPNSSARETSEQPLRPHQIVHQSRSPNRADDAVREEPIEEGDGDNIPLSFKLDNLKTEHAYFAERGLTQQTVELFGLGFCAKGTMSGRVVIPIHNIEGQLVAYCGRLPGPPMADRPKYKLPNGFKKSFEVFNLDRAMVEEQGLPLIVVEGFFDVMKLWQLGFHRVVSIMGSSLSARQEALLLKASESRQGIILMFDEDDAGRAGREKSLVRLARQTFVRVVPLPQEGAQPDHLTENELHALLD